MNDPITVAYSTRRSLTAANSNGEGRKPQFVKAILTSCGNVLSLGQNAPKLAALPTMPDHRSPKTDGHAVGGGKGARTQADQLTTGAFDLLSGQIDALRQEIDYLKEQVALLQVALQENAPRKRVPVRGEQDLTHRDSSS